MEFYYIINNEQKGFLYTEEVVNMKCEKRKNGISIFLLIFAIFVIVASLVTQENIYNPTWGTGSTIIEPVEETSVDDATDVYLFQIDDIDETNNTFLFYTNHLEVFVYIEDELIYALESDDSIFGRTPGAKWNIFSLPVDVEEIRVETIQVYPSLAKQDIEFQLGNAITMQRDVVINSIKDVCVCLAILIIGVALYVYWWVVFRKTNEQREVMYLGLFAIDFGVWAVGETQLAVFMFENRAFWSYMAFTCLMTMCLPFLLFVREFLETEDKYLQKGIGIYIVLETFIAQFLHLTGIASVKETVMFTITSIVLTLLYLLYAILTAVKNKKNKRKIIANILGVIALVGTIVIDMSGYFTNVSEANQMGKVGFLIYAIILGLETARVAQQRVQENHKAKIYLEMAVKDMPTGCYNRNAYSEDTNVGVELTGLQLITFDLNNLKVCNDTKGHMAGDKYIADAAHMIQDVFQGLGKVYRIGGDEFCIIARNISESTILDRREMLKVAIKQYRQENSDEGFGIACGYATFDPEIDKDIEETRHRADLSMYDNKKEIKALN